MLFSKNHSEYASDKFVDPYKPLAYVNCQSNGNPKTLGLDVDEPFFRFPTEIGGGSSTYMCDYYYQNTGNRVALVGGTFGDRANDGLWYWNLNNTSSNANWNIGCRVLILFFIITHHLPEPLLKIESQLDWTSKPIMA